MDSLLDRAHQPTLHKNAPLKSSIELLYKLEVVVTACADDTMEATDSAPT